MAETEEKEQPIVIKRIVKGGHGHHGGAWKVAYADFVTAMMAFFLLMWLLNTVTAEEKNAISSYFDPAAPQIADSTSGSGGAMGGLSISPEGALVTELQPAIPPEIKTVVNKGERMGEGGQDANEIDEDSDTERQNPVYDKLREIEDQNFAQTQEEIMKAIEEDPALEELKDNILIDMTPEGLRIQIIDKDGQPMFLSGSAEILDKHRQLLSLVSGIIVKLPNDLSVRGHTDSVPGSNPAYTNWELSADRANTSRRVITESGFPEGRIHNVMGKAATDPLLKEDPENQQNRRISIILMREELTKTPEELAARQQEIQPNNGEIEREVSDEPKQQVGGDPTDPTSRPKVIINKNPGRVYFP